MPESEEATQSMRSTALFVSAFFDELIACGVREVVVSPGSRSTPLAMVAYVSPLRLYVDIDERGAAFFALGLAKAGRRPVCFICTSGTAVANCYPAILEAEASRVPLIVLTGDRPPRLQNLGAPQTCDQTKAFGGHVRHFQQMPPPDAAPATIAYARQMGKTAFLHAQGGEAAGPVHFNFPFDEPLKPDLGVEGLFVAGRGPLDVQRDGQGAPRAGCPPCVIPGEIGVPADQAAAVAGLLQGRRGIVLAGEGSCAGAQEAREIVAWARYFGLPLLADPLSGLRSIAEAPVIDNYDNICGKDTCPPFDLVIRFGRYPVSKRCATAIKAVRPLQVVVDTHETRDFNAATDVFVRATPLGFVRSLMALPLPPPAPAATAGQRGCTSAWIARNHEERVRIEAVSEVDAGFEGAYVAKLFELVPERSLVFAANSMPIRAVDTFFLKSSKELTLLANRGLNGIDGTLSTALGAAQHFAHTAFLTGDLTLLHDLNALALHRELTEHCQGEKAPGIVVVVLNNHGGGIFDMLPQKSDEAYFERLFTTPQQVDFAQAASAFGVPYRQVATVAEFALAYRQMQGNPGISMIEAAVPLEGVEGRYGRFW